MTPDPHDPAALRTIRNYLEWSDAGRPAIWRYLIAVVLGFLCWIIGNVPAIVLMRDLLADPATRSVAILYTFAIGLLAVPLITRLLLGRPGYSVAIPGWPPRWRDYGLGVVAGWGVMAVLELAASPFTGIHYRGWGAEVAQGLPLLLASLGGFAIQTAFEEVYFRGLVAQAVRRVVKWMPVVLLVPALFFAQLHIGNVASFGGGAAAMLPYLAAALTLGWAAWRSGSLLLAMGLHFANNTFLLLFVSSEGDVIRSAAPFVLPAQSLSRALPFAVLQGLLTVAVVEWALRRRERRAAA